MSLYMNKDKQTPQPKTRTIKNRYVSVDKYRELENKVKELEEEIERLKREWFVGCW